MSMPSSRLEVATTAGSRGLQVLLDLGPLLLGDRTVVGTGDDGRCPLRRARAAHQLGRGVGLLQGLAGRPLVGDLVQPVAQTLGQTTRVGEHDRRAVRLDEVGDPLLDVRPDGGLLRALLAVGGRGPAQLSQVLHRDHHGEVELLARRRLDDLHLALRREIARHLVHGAHRRGEADTPGGLRQQLVEALQGEREMGAALGARHRVHLVQDHRLDARQRVARGRGQHQEQRLGGRDQDVRRAGGQRPALGGRGVTGTDAHLHLRLRQPEPHGLLPDAGQGTAQIPLHVDRECLER